MRTFYSAQYCNITQQKKKNEIYTVHLEMQYTWNTIYKYYRFQ